MTIIDEIRSKNQLSKSQIVDLFDEILDRGHILIIKADGAREENGYTCMITVPNKPTDFFRRDGQDLLETLCRVVSDYDA